MILQIDGRTDSYTYGRLDGHTEIWTDPNCIVIKNFVTKFLLLLVIFRYPTKKVSGLTLVYTQEQRTAGYEINIFCR